jgi:hypothetical protein
MYRCLTGSRGEPEAFFESSYRIYGKHPGKVWPHILATRQAKLGEEFRNWYDAAVNGKPNLAKKTGAPVRFHPASECLCGWRSC